MSPVARGFVLMSAQNVCASRLAVSVAASSRNVAKVRIWKRAPIPLSPISLAMRRCSILTLYLAQAGIQRRNTLQ